MKKLTTDDFIKKAKSVHGDKYDYSKVLYNGSGNNIIVICKEHGEFIIKPYNHLSGLGCPKCGIIKRSNTRKKQMDEKTFFSKAIEKFKDQYTYEKTDYVDFHTEISVTCKDHGDFNIMPYKFLLNTKPCSLCANNKIKTTELFIKESKSIYGTDTYKYDLTIYNGSNKELNIICKKHGIYSVKPVNHLFNNCGCPKCIKKQRYNTESCVEKIKELYGDLYDCKDVIYKGINNPIILYCLNHGQFEITPHALFLGLGCKLCGIEKRNKKVVELAKKEFENKANIIHGNKYDYSKVNYINTKTLVSIICPKHGVFLQSPLNHLRHCGCIKCHESSLERTIRIELEKNNIHYILEKRFKWLGLLKLDFYLPLYNIAIECLGILHFENISFNGHYDENIIRKNIEKDKNKLNKCIENNIILLYYSETSYNNFLNNYVYHNADELIKNIMANGAIGSFK